jgi:hypothetical protein
MRDDPRTPAERAYAVWFRHTYPLAVGTAAYAWYLLEPATRALWEQIAQAACPRGGGARAEDASDPT